MSISELYKINTYSRMKPSIDSSYIRKKFPIFLHPYIHCEQDIKKCLAHEAKLIEIIKKNKKKKERKKKTSRGTTLMIRDLLGTNIINECKAQTFMS